MEFTISKDIEAGTLTVVGSFEATVERLWRLWSDPRQLERWWGPDPYPATVVDHDLRPGGHVSYYMTGPEGDQHKGYWTVLEVEAPRRLVVRDGFADADGSPDNALPTSQMEVTITDLGGGRAEMRMFSTYATSEALATVIEMGMEIGITQAFSQIEGLLAED